MIPNGNDINKNSLVSNDGSCILYYEQTLILCGKSVMIFLICIFKNTDFVKFF